MSTFDFNQSRSLVVSPQTLANVQIPGTIISTEYQSSELTNWFDRLSGIDAIIKTPEETMYGVALRNQFVESVPFNTFSVRYNVGYGIKTEYAKRVTAIASGYLFYPYYTIQAYYDESNGFLSAAKIKTQDLFGFLNDYDEYVGDGVNGEDGNLFKTVKWSHLKKLNYDIFITSSL